jgi:hypothetical protein
MSQARPTITVAAQVTGLQRAVQRLEEAGAALDPVDTFVPLFEALNWVASIDQRIGSIWRPTGARLTTTWRMKVPHGPQIAAVTWVRNAVHHEWIDALTLDPSGHGLVPADDLLTGPNMFPRADHAWLWRPVTDLPATKPRTKRALADGEPDGREAYEASLAGRSASETLAAMLPSFRFVLTLLEPPRPTSR